MLVSVEDILVPSRVTQRDKLFKLVLHFCQLCEPIEIDFCGGFVFKREHNFFIIISLTPLLIQTTVKVVIRKLAKLIYDSFGTTWKTFLESGRKIWLHC